MASHWTITIIISATCVLTSTGIMAEENRGPESVTAEERRLMTTASADYQYCLHSEVENVPVEVTDPRIIADSAMHACNQVLIKLDDELEQRGFASDFRQHSLRRTTQRAARDLMQHAMVISAQRTSE